CAFNPEPLADFIDIALLGDGEEAVVEICEAIRTKRKQGLGRRQICQDLRHIEGVYVPELFTPHYNSDGTIRSIEPHLPDYPGVTRRYLADLDSTPYPTRPLIPYMNTVHNRVALEIARGCTRGCRFCQAGYIYRPVRERQAGTLVKLAEEALANSGFDELSLLSLSSGDYSAIEPLLRHLMEQHAEDRVAMSLPSLRVGSLTDELINEIRKVRKTGFTLAPEAGTERLRQLINKGIEAEDLLDSARTIYTLGWRLIKLYFMLGLPTENTEDLQGIVDLAAAVKRCARGTVGGGDVNVAVSTFVPKAHTPFQWEAQLNLEQTKERQSWLRDALRKKKLRLKWHEAELSVLEGVFARGDRRLGAVIATATDLGCCFDSWRDFFDFSRWETALQQSGLTFEFYLRERSMEEILPWEHLSCGIPKEFFARERAKALELEYTPDCRTGTCSQCGVCDFTHIKMRYAEASPTLPAAEPEAAPEEERFKIRMQMSKTGKARFISHLEFMTVVNRALRRIQAPVRYSAGFHPHPRISFPDALPTGVESLTEIIDIELFRQPDPADFTARLNAELPKNFKVVHAQELPCDSPVPAMAIHTSSYWVPLNPEFPPDLHARINAALRAESILHTRTKKDKQVEVDLRPDIADLNLDQSGLELTLYKGSPVVVTAYLLRVTQEQVRSMGMCKTKVSMKSAL
ncbi:MAG: TIGR03960 family B12-binding radical SAM protein, partial [Desulfuromonadaceae bacterium]|nr:TIGR03960 family B12-binding radical SAM protein [Desulfuromonadaceae bacterium]